MFCDSSGGLGEECGADAAPVLVMHDVQVVDDAAPAWILLEDDMDEADKARVVLRQQGGAVGRGGQAG